MIDTNKIVPDGFILLQTQNGTPKYAACMTGRLAGWLMKKYPDGNWVSERKLTNLEVMQAEDQRDDGIVHETPAATIQEPVMVAEPVGDGLPPEVQKLFDQLRPEIDYWCTHRRESNLAALDAIEFRFKVSQARTVRLERAALAAPMVADPAGAAFDREEFIQQVSVSIAEMDRDSPEGQPEMMLVTPDELQNTMRSVFDRFDGAATVKAVPSEALCLRCALSGEVTKCGHQIAASLADKTGGGE